MNSVAASVRVCGCGCGASIAHLSPQAAFLNRAHTKRFERARLRAEAEQEKQWREERRRADAQIRAETRMHARTVHDPATSPTLICECVRYQPVPVAFPDPEGEPICTSCAKPRRAPLARINGYDVGLAESRMLIEGDDPAKPARKAGTA